MIAIIAEKPSVAQDIARVLGINDKKDGFWEGNGYLVTWAYGHLVSLALPEDYTPANTGNDELPIIPHPFKLVPRKVKTPKRYRTDGTAKKQLAVIKSVFSKCESIIVATDAGREGELIFRYIYKYLKCRKPFSRLWINSLTDTAIQEGFNNLKDGKQYDNLYLAAEARSKADWLLGINASRALCMGSGNTNHSLGRVQTPTLALICKRYNENVNFVAQPYWQAIMNVKKNDSVFQIKGTDLFFIQKEADSLYKNLKTYPLAKVSKVERKATRQEPPLLHDLASLQKIANIQYGFSADKTLETAQKLYERKLITYPRTGSRYIPEDVFKEIPGLIEGLKTYTPFANYARLLSVLKLNTHTVNAKKVTDHHALLITGIRPQRLGEEEKIIYDLVAGRLLESFSRACLKDVTDISICCDDISFSAKGSIVRDKGWRDVFNFTDDENEQKEEYATFPPLEEGDFLSIESHNLVQKSTKPKPLFTEAGLLTAMETAGKEVQDEELRAALKECGIGTPATRAAIIETLFARKYMERHNKTLVPTKKGLVLYNSVKAMRIADAELTGSWEQALLKIEKNPDFFTSFIGGIEVFTKQIVSEIISITQAGNTADKTEYICPRCRLGKVSILQEVAKCNYSKCHFIVFREICGRTLTIEEIDALLTKGKTPLINDFKNKKERTFEAYIVLDKQGKPTFQFPDKNRK